jgi:hypothetical protein
MNILYQKNVKVRLIENTEITITKVNKKEGKQKRANKRAKIKMSAIKRSL